ncbi:MAG TPA: hypothetical protein PK878_18730 [bacterium]|nr:hypothetical protein [bacterium]
MIKSNKQHHSQKRVVNLMILISFRFSGRWFPASLIGLVLLSWTAGFAHPDARVFPQAPLLVYPPQGAVLLFPGEGALIPFSWEPVEGALEYFLYIRVGNNLTKFFISPSSSIRLDLNLKETDSHAAVSWSVLSVSGTIMSPTPEISTFSFGPTGIPVPGYEPEPLPAPVLILPENGKNFSPTDQAVTFLWSAVTGAARYELTVYKDNEPYIQRSLNDIKRVESFQQQIYDLFQWEVRAVDPTGRYGLPTFRHYFSIGQGILPTPTPYPVNPDYDGNQRLSAHDLYFYAELYATNDPRADYNNSGLNDKNDLLRFLELFVAGRR